MLTDWHWILPSLLTSTAGRVRIWAITSANHGWLYTSNRGKFSDREGNNMQVVGCNNYVYCLPFDYASEVLLALGLQN